MSKWISVEERLPEEEEICLFFVPGHPVTSEKMGIFTPTKILEYPWKSTNFVYYDNKSVTHWMPLPAPPEKK